MIGVIDFVLLAVIGGVTYCVGREGAMSAVCTFFVVLFSALLAMNFFEPLAARLGFLGLRADSVALLVPLAVLIFAGRLACERLAPDMLQLPAVPFEVARWGFGLMTGYLTCAILLTALHTTALPREFYGFRAERAMLLDADAPDRRWLGLTRYVTGRPLGKLPVNYVSPDGQLLGRSTRSFDGRTAMQWEAPTPPGQAAVMVRMPSFLIRYADRRQTGVNAPTAATSGGGGNRGEARDVGPAF